MHGQSDTVRIDGVEVRGIGLDSETRCAHFDGDRDVIAIKFRCCGTYYPCHACHQERADHPADVWPRSTFDSEAVLCGVCGTELTIEDYLAADFTCPTCGAAFNPGCAEHYQYYFETPTG